MVGVLHTWTRQLIYHPHLHFIVTGGGLADDGSWKFSRSDFLVPVKALSVIFRAKFRHELKKTALFTAVAAGVWKKKWVVHSEPVGSGLSAFKYLAPYIFRVALSNNRLVKFEPGQVTFSYKESATDRIKLCTLTAAEFIRRFLQHVLPPRFIKVRYYGLLSPRHRHLLEQARQLLEGRSYDAAQTAPAKVVTAESNSPSAIDNRQSTMTPLRCPHCGQPLTLLGPLKPKARSP